MNNGYEKFDEIFKDGLEDYQVSPPVGLWDKIAPEIPVATPIPIYKQPRFWTAASIFMLLLLSSTAYFFSNYSIEINPKDELDKKLELKEDTETTTPNETALLQHQEKATALMATVANTITTTPITSLSKQVATTSKDVETQNNSDKQNSTFNSKNNKAKVSKALLFNNLSDFKPSFESKNFIAYMPKENNVVTNKQTFSNSTTSTAFASASTGVQTSEAQASQKALTPFELKEIENEHLALTQPSSKASNPILPPTINKVSGFHVGTFSQYHGVFTLNKIANAANKSDMTIYHPGSGYAYGISMGYDFKNNTGIQAEWVVNASMVQQAEYQGYIQNKINEYAQFPVLFKYRKAHQSRLTKNTMVLNHLIGIQYGYLKSSQTNGISSTSDEFQVDNNLGLVLGMDYDVYLGSSTLFSLGVRSSFNRRINTFSKIINETTPNINVLFGIQAGIKYRFNK